MEIDSIARDAVTGLWEMRPFANRVSELMDAHNGQLIAGLLVVEIERMHQLFRVHGQGSLDQAMSMLVRRLLPICGPDDLICRFAQTQFAIFLPGLDHAGKALFAASAIANSMGETISIEGQQIHVSAKIGVAVSPADATDGPSLIRNACIALEQALSSGTASYLHFTRSMRSELKEKLDLEDALRAAIREDQLTVHYQPKVAIQDGTPVGGEALLRWTHPDRGMIPPNVFIPTAEETGLIVPIGEWVLRKAINQIREWLDEGLPPIQIAVNVSERQFRWGHLPALIDVLLAESRIPPHLLQLEITETILPDDLEGALQQMRWIADRGVALALDDFGTGYSSLSYLRELPLDCLKVDRQFVSDMERDQSTRHIVEAIVAMAQAMDLKVVAEGIETPAQWDILRRLGVEEGQGYLFARPMPAEAFAAFVRHAGAEG
ncbi:putative bifunctional diguanylate cyclase/phosphodiesterase [Niveispirillum irakense]|uniref:putative bifunctional diguanylate cyclase/phosphodiesterase n=1 Tax=Niveispirillum irakense TaxID=34011 RepID=UPI000403FEEC|nr:GGDEF domain-containing phosphodiesterase [Niveispirillum irakense]